MSENTDIKPEEKEKEVNQNDNTDTMKQLEKRLQAIEEKNQALEDLNNDLSSKNQTLESEIGSIREKVDNTDDMDELKKEFKNRKKKEEERKLSQKEEELLEKEKKINQLTLKSEIDNYIKEKPHLEDLINDLVSTVDIDNIDDLKSKITPGMEERNELAYQVRKKKEEAGGDPLQDYDGKVVTSKEKEDILHKKRVEARMKGASLEKIARTIK